MAATDPFTAEIANIRQQVEEGLRQLDLPARPQYLYEPVRYGLGGTAKRLRPVLVTLAGRSFDADESDLLNAALAVEILHNFTLVHDDIMDGDDQRHGQASVHRRWDVSTAILAGVGMFTLSQLLIGKVLTNPVDCWTRFNQATMEICEGQAYDKQFEQSDEISLDDYLAMVGKKTGNLLGLCAELGGIIGEQSNEICAGLYRFGLLLGQAFQIQDDILEITADATAMGKSLGSDIAAGKQTVLTIAARERNPGEWQVFCRENVKLNPVDTRKAYYDYYQLTGVLQHSRQLADEYIEKARQALSELTDDQRRRLLNFADLVLTRKK